MKTIIAVAILLLCNSLTVSAAVETCTPIRPSGLQTAQVDDIVVAKVAEALHRPKHEVDTSKTLRQLDHSEMVMVRLAYVVVAVSDTLGFDAAAAFLAGSKANGKENVAEGLSIAQMQGIARKAYFAGIDSPPPVPKPGTTFGTRILTVDVPVRPPGWSQVSCTFQSFSFKLTHDGSVYTAAVSEIQLEPFTSDSAFVAQLTKAASSAFPPGYAVTISEARISRATAPQCAEYRGEARLEKREDGTSRRLDLLAKTCYDARYPHLGYIAMFAQEGLASHDSTATLAAAFFDGVRPVRN